jgi:hypothetical protein
MTSLDRSYDSFIFVEKFGGQKIAFLSRSGVNVMITIFAKFSGKNWPFSLQTNVIFFVCLKIRN